MLSAFAMSNLQEVLAVLRVFDSAGVGTVAEAMNLIGRAVGGPYPNTEDVEQLRRKDRCPSCGMGLMYICRATSIEAGVPVAMCSRHCGYSEVRNANI